MALRLKEARKDARLTQQQVADMVGISQNNYSYWENEKVKIDNLSLQRLASIFGVSVGYLLGVEEQQEQQVAFIGGADDLTEEEVDQVQDFIAYLKSKRK